MPYRYLTAALHVNRESKEFVRGAVRDRLDKLRLKLMLTWNELQERLGVSESMLYFMRTGARHPSPKMLRRIMELETEAGLSVFPSRPLLVKESPVEYTPSVERKHLDIVQIRRQVTEMERQLAALKRLLEDSNADNG
jgi:transcriptional regulator with XRE-family HTH domain